MFFFATILYFCPKQRGIKLEDTRSIFRVEKKLSSSNQKSKCSILLASTTYDVTVNDQSQHDFFIGEQQ